ncbi:probable G-protein coupled receptor 173 [Acanthaster planci]|uniref:Probable G-protein coupled receptor 173 n=1 Tax=Acanthaster planci TaxID=133434 RepID=A0A8B7Z0S5_ACAPL|nr:probable G-protein coupled receptor 173 [Acanthaster planci]XP_022098562.1 probable G-protein coupled receptor 173 [Acanthaster planci]
MFHISAKVRPPARLPPEIYAALPTTESAPGMSTPLDLGLGGSDNSTVDDSTVVIPSKTVTNIVDTGDGNEVDLPDDHGPRVLWCSSLILVIILSVVGNGILSVVVFGNARLRRPCYFFLFNCALADFVRSVLCFPFVVSAVISRDWIYSDSLCEILAFFNVYLTYGALYTLFLISIERYVVLRFHRFHRQKLKGPACLLLVLASWALAVSMAFPPVFNTRTYSFIEVENQCTFKHREYKTNETMCFLMFFVAVIAFTHFAYFRVFLFMRAHRKMRPMQFVPAVSNNWTFYGPGSTGQAAANWFLGYRQGPTPPPLIGLAPPSNNNSTSLSKSDFEREEKFCKLSLSISISFSVLWLPYTIHCFWQVFQPANPLPHSYVSLATWMTFFQACINPILCFVVSKEFRQIALQHVFGASAFQQDGHNVQL